MQIPAAFIYTPTAAAREFHPLRPSLSALRSNAQAEPQKTRAVYVTTTLAIGAGMLPKLSCPACWPAYTAVLSSLGIGFVDYMPYMLPLTIAFLAPTLFLIGFRASHRNGYAPLILGIGASALILGGKFLLERDAIMFTGIALLVCASIWNSLPLRAKGTRACLPCAR